MKMWRDDVSLLNDVIDWLGNIDCYLEIQDWWCSQYDVIEPGDTVVNKMDYYGGHGGPDLSNSIYSNRKQMCNKHESLSSQFLD
jgi:hypothetical protein